MSSSFFRPDPVADKVDAVLALLQSGHAPREIEREKVDVKEEAGRRDPKTGAVLPGQRTSEVAAAALAGELVCMANTPGGGALIVGIANKGERIGTALDVGWLRHRIFQLTERQLTVTVRETALDTVRLLVITAPEAIEPIRYQDRLKWRVGDNCVEIDAASWHATNRYRLGVDWSAEASGHPVDAASEVAVEYAREYLRAAAKRGDEGADELANATTPELLRRINVVTGDDVLTNAGALLFVGTPHDGIDYIRRDVAGGDSTQRVRSSMPLLAQIRLVEYAANAANRLVHVPHGFSHGQLHELPMLALREAIVNGAIHRDWRSTLPTTVEYVGSAATVTSPGGFLGGVKPSNIITHPSAPRYRSLAESVAALRLAEREGVGVDRMVREMLALGHPAPEIAEIEGPYVRVTLVGGPPNSLVVNLLASMTPANAARDVNMLLLLHYLMTHGWVDVRRATPVLQRSTTETESVIRSVSGAETAKGPVIVEVRGVPDGHPPAFRLSNPVRKQLSARTSPRQRSGARMAMILEWARARGRVSSTETADITGIALNSAAELLQKLEGSKALKPGRETRAGRGFFYVPTNGQID